MMTKDEDDTETPAAEPTKHTWVNQKDAERYGEAKTVVVPLRVVERPRKTKKTRRT
jgi:hypothetical protein